MKLITYLISLTILQCLILNKIEAHSPLKKDSIKNSKDSIYEIKLKGLYKFGMTKSDKKSFPAYSRAYIIRKQNAKTINQYFNCKFYGNGKGVFFLDRGKQKFETRNMIVNHFLYKIKNNKVYVKDGLSKKYKLLIEIIEKSKNSQYFKVKIKGFDTMNYGMYRIAKLPKKKSSH